MGLFSSDYKAYGSVSFSQISIQRKWDDSYLGDLIFRNTYTDKAIADNMREDILHGYTAKLRRYYKTGKHYGFVGEFFTYSGLDPSGIEEAIKDVDPQFTKLNIFYWDRIDVRYISYSELCIENDLCFYTSKLEEPGAQDEYIGEATINGDLYKIKDEFTYDIIYMGFTIEDENGNEDQWYTGKKRENLTDPIDGELIEDYAKDGLIAEYVSKEYIKYFFSRDTKFRDGGFESYQKMDIFPIVSLKDNGNKERPYYEIKPDDPNYKTEYIPRRRTLRKLGVDFDEISKQNFDPDDVPEYGSAKWNRSYGRVYKEDEELQKKYPTERAYYDHVKKSHKEMKENLCYVTDEHFGLFASVKTLNIRNVDAIMDLIYDIHPHLMLADADSTFYSDKPILNFEETPKTYAFKIVMGSMKVIYTIDDFLICVRQGVVRDRHDKQHEPPKYRKGKTNYIRTFQRLDRDVTRPFYYDEDGFADDPSDMIGSTVPADPIVEIIHDIYNIYDIWQRNDDAMSDPDYDPNSPFDRYGNPMKTNGCVVLQKQLGRSNESESPKYLEVRLYNPSARHIIDVISDCKYSKGFTVSVFGGLLDDKNNAWDDEEYSDTIIFPILHKTYKDVPFFERERFMRECEGVVIDGIKVQEIKWYQKGIFQVLMFFVLLFITWIFTPAASFATVLTQTIMKYAIGIIVSTFMKLIKVPFLAVLFQFAFTFLFGGGIDFTSLADVASMAIEATGTYVQKVLANKMIQLQKEAEALKERINDEKKKLTRLQKETGVGMFDDVNRALWLATLPPIEDPDSWMRRVVNRDTAIVEIDEYRKMEIENRFS